MLTTSIVLFVLSNVLGTYGQKEIIKSNWNYTPYFKRSFFIGLGLGYSFWIVLFYLQCYTIITIVAALSIVFELFKLILKARYER